MMFLYLYFLLQCYFRALPWCEKWIWCEGTTDIIQTSLKVCQLFYNCNLLSGYKYLIFTQPVVSRFLSRGFHPKSRRLFPFYISNIALRTDIWTFGVTGAVFKIAGEMPWLPAYFDNPAQLILKTKNITCNKLFLLLTVL